METETGNTSSVSSTMKTTTWRIIHGALDQTVTVESSLSPEDSDSVAVDISRKPPLVLRRAASTDGPCEITVGRCMLASSYKDLVIAVLFTQQHEIRQIYVKSTARVYEVYYAAKSKSENEYLCTVRCGMAAKVEIPEVTKDYDALQATEVEGSAHLSSNIDNQCLSAAESRINSGSSSGEDGWVEVKVPASSWMQNGDSSFPNQIFLEKGSQEFYEATAEISDADPCVSLTLRLLSIQEPETACIDEIYVFADPVMSTNIDCPPNRVENSAGNALMSMFIPTLLQLSNSHVSNIQEGHYSYAPERRVQDAETKLVSSAISSGDILQKVILEKENDYPVDPTRLETSKKNLDDEDNPDCNSGAKSFSSNHLGKTLDQLVSRVSKIEDFCLRFEKNMLNPIVSMEARLERMEQQLQLLMKDSRSAIPAYCTRIFAPEFSCDGSESSSFYDDGNNCCSCIPPELFNKHDSHDEELSVQHCDLPISSTSTSHLLPSLVVTAPEFSYIDEEEERDAVDPTEDSPKHNLDKPLSIDDALASALAGFLSSCSTPLESACIPEVHPNHSTTDDGDDGECNGDRLTSSMVQGDKPLVPPVDQNVSNLIAGMKSLFLSSNEDSEEIVEPEFPISYYNSGETVGSADGGESHSGEKLLGFAIESEPEQVDKRSSDTHSTGQGFLGEESAIELSKSFISDDTDPFVLHCSQSNVDSNVASKPAVDERASVSRKEVTGEVSDILQNVLQLPSASVVDFTVAVLDVEFLPKEDSVSFEDLLGEIREPYEDVACAAENDGDVNGVPTLLVDIEDGESVASFALDPHSVDFNYYGSLDLPLDISGKEHQDSHVCNGQDAHASLI
ncbi:hypothetical protein Dimus_023335 [Dionaea muscipula]